MAVDRPLSSADSKTATAVRRLYTPAMLAELLVVPVAAIRRWHRRRALREVKCVRRLPYFDFQEVAIARRLAQLLKAGCSLRIIDRRLEELDRLFPGVERPLADASLVIEGRRLYLRRGDELAEPGGQTLLDFEPREEDDDYSHATISFTRFAAAHPAVIASSADDHGAVHALVERLEQDALDWEDEGHLDRAAEAYRTLLIAAGPTAEVNFALADILYRAGDLSAARERYYAALELDEEYVEARAALGCVLAETGELELAAATFEGALGFHGDFADVHFHLANTLDRLERGDEATAHYRTFLELAPESPWAEAARDRLLLGSAAR
jgi:tetratricopeptide (TPR) repeat protein